jgi:hypothetical protein
MTGTARMIAIVTEHMWLELWLEVPMGSQLRQQLFQYEFWTATVPDLLLASLQELTGLFNITLLVLQQLPT